MTRCAQQESEPSPRDGTNGDGSRQWRDGGDHGVGYRVLTRPESEGAAVSHRGGSNGDRCRWDAQVSTCVCEGPDVDRRRGRPAEATGTGAGRDGKKCSPQQQSEHCPREGEQMGTAAGSGGTVVMTAKERGSQALNTDDVPTQP